MFIKDIMTKDPVTIQMNASINSLMALMKDNHLKRVPVLDGDRVVGIVTEKDIEKVSPSKATTLSVFEINYLLSKSTVKDAMNRNFFSVPPDIHAEDAALLMREEGINTLLVMDGESLEGIVTESDLFEALIDILGARTPGTRFLVRLEDKPGVLNKMSGVVAQHNVNISHLATIPTESHKTIILLRTDAVDEDIIDDISAEFESLGYEIIERTIKD